MNDNSYPRETDEVQPVTVTVDGTEVTEAVTFALTQHSDRPETWIAPYTVGDVTGVRVQGLDPGIYYVWAKVTDSPEIPVINCGYFRVT